MGSVRALNLIQYWIMRNAEEKDQIRVRAMMTGPLKTTVPEPEPKPDGKPRIQPPWWWGNDEDVSTGNIEAARRMSRRR